MVPALVCLSNTDGSTPVLVYADPTTHRLLVDANLTGGGTSMTDDAAFTPGTTAITPIGAFFDDVAPDSVNEGDGGAVRMSGNRNLYVTIRDAAGNERGLNIDASGGLTVAAHAVTNAGVFAVQVDGVALTALQLIDDTVFADDAAFTPATSKVNAIGFLVDDTATDSVDEGDIGIPRMSADRIQYVQGALAHDAVDANNPLKVGGQARTTNPTAVADADRSNFITDKLGKQVVVGSIRDLKAFQHTSISSSTAETTVLTAVASTFLDVYGCIVANSSATGTEVTFKDSTAGTTRFIIAVPAGETRGFMLPESAAHNQATVNTNWTATCADSVAAILISMFAVKNI